MERIKTAYEVKCPETVVAEGKECKIMGAQ